MNVIILKYLQMKHCIAHHSLAHHRPGSSQTWIITDLDHHRPLLSQTWVITDLAYHRLGWSPTGSSQTWLITDQVHHRPGSSQTRFITDLARSKPHRGLIFLQLNNTLSRSVTSCSVLPTCRFSCCRGCSAVQIRLPPILYIALAAVH